MKNIIKLIFLSSCFLFSCDNYQVETTSERVNRIAEVVEIDGCEYLVGWNTMAHKGNCKNLIHKCKCK